MELIFIPSVGYSSNSVVLQCAGETILIDPGISGDTDAIREMHSHGIDMKEIGRIILTHCHYDHAEACRMFGCPVYAYGKDAEALRKGDDQATAAAMFNAHLEIPEIRDIAEKDVCGFQVLPSPGHTEGSICLYMEPYLISGDVVFSEGVGRYDLPGGSYGKLRQSIERLSKLDFDYLIPGHGPMGTKESVLMALEELSASERFTDIF